MTDGKGQAPNPETDPGPAGFIDEAWGWGRERVGPVAHASRAAFAAMSVRCWEPSRPMRETAR
ncbi:hypothetical protein GCM10017779_57710 [Streptomyces capillispiralis]|uniref:Uncharacterized protein n=1 Tax=Streptomyces capillispiralis TaxID=68182 RepID=A0A561THJ8_9ACTN|nr:hypothetical protein FHX78_113562 [Streptomyces capillispiralis]GHH95314.1 hypothetical protein GCM10017779_57710 [Streptomyces capillispiralis]